MYVCNMYVCMQLKNLATGLSMKKGFLSVTSTVHLWCIRNKLVLRKDTNIIHLAMGGGQKFYTCWGGFRKFGGLRRGFKKSTTKIFNCQAPHQSIYEHSLSSSTRFDNDNTRNPIASARAVLRQVWYLVGIRIIGLFT